MTVTDIDDSKKVRRSFPREINHEVGLLFFQMPNFYAAPTMALEIVNRQLPRARRRNTVRGKELGERRECRDIPSSRWHAMP
jgi:hypothetical protein